MTEESSPESQGAAARALPALRSGAEAALPDGGRRRVVVHPDEVWDAPGRIDPEAIPPAEAVRAARRSFFAPILMVVALSSVLMAAALAILALGLRLAG